MNVTDFTRAGAVPLLRPGCVGMSVVPIGHADNFSSTALFFAERAHSDQHSAPYPQMLVVTLGRGWVSVGAERERVHGGQAILLPPEVAHQFWTESESMEALSVAWALRALHGRSLVVTRDKDEMARRAAEWFVLRARHAIQQRGRFTVALSGGSTPRGLYEQLARAEFGTQVDWAHVHFFWGDERAVPPDDAQSNYRMANEPLLSKIPAPQGNIHRIEAERGAEDAARAYEQTLREFFRDADPYPRFDLILLGLGDNGHTASLFPQTRVLHEKEKWVAAEDIEEIRAWRITLTAPLINHADNVMFLVSGKQKASVFADVWERKGTVEEIPALLINPDEGDVMWLVDDAAAQKIPHAENFPTQAPLPCRRVQAQTRKS